MSSIEMPAFCQTKNSTNSSFCSDDKSKMGCVIMASGLGKRYGGNKLLANLGDKPLISWILDATKDLFDYRVVVTRSEDIKIMCEQAGINVILHTLSGRNDTVKLGLEAIGTNIDYCVFTPADQPFITRDSIEKLLAEAKAFKDYIVRCSYGERVGAPVCFPKWTFDELLTLPQGKGGNEVVKRYMKKVCNVEVSDERELDDIDTTEDMELARSRVKNIL